MTTEIATLIFDAETSDLTQAEKKLDRVAKQGAKTEVAAKGVTRQFRVMKGATQQLGFQVQDIAVQLAGGQNAMVVFGQQGSQIASLFGPGGAVLGAIFAVGAALGTAFAPALLNSADAAEDLEEALKKLSDTVKIAEDGTILLSEEFERLAATSREVAEVQLKARLVTATQAANAAFSELKDTASDLNVRLATSGNALRGNANIISRTAKEYGITSDELIKIDGLIDNLIETKSLDTAKELQKVLIDVALSGRGANEAFVELTDDVNASISVMQQQKDIMDLITDSSNDLDGALRESGESYIKLAEDVEEAESRMSLAFDRMEERRIKDEERKIEKLEREHEKVIRLEERLTEKLEAEAKRRQQIESAIENQILTSKLDFAGQVAGVLEAGAKKGTALQKAAFAAQQAIAVATTILSTEAAATAALAPPPIGLGPVAGLPYSQTIRGIGYASAGLQAGLAVGELAGRAQGGQVQPNTAYRVGEFGPETLVMGSNGGTVVPKAANDGAKIDLVTNVQIIGGSGNAEVTNTTRQISDTKFVQDIIVREMSDSTSAGRRALQNTSNVTSRGTR